jgi:hypothetical protein
MKKPRKQTKQTPPSSAAREIDPAALTGATGGTPPDPYIGHQHNETAVRVPRRARRSRSGRRS